MKDKTITVVHFEYVNEQIKILGFKNLADFKTVISYQKLKKEQKNICEKINLSIKWFKKLFPQEGFDLRKINYLFENIDQVLGFIKKLFKYMSIQYDYSRIKGIPTLRLIQPNNLYNNYIMNLRNIPQKENFTLQKENNIEKKNTIQIDHHSNIDQLEDSIIEPDIIDKSKNLADDDDLKNIDKSYFSEMKPDNKKYPIMKLTEIFNKFEKKEISKIFIDNNRVDLSTIPIDWINTISVSIIKSNTNKSTSKYEPLPLGTAISLIIGEDEIILHTINNDKENDKIKINIPNNFLYQYSTVFLEINIPDKTNELIKNLTNNLNFKYKYDGWKIINKTITTEFVDKIILFDDKLFYDFNLGIYNENLKIKIKDYYNTINNQINHDENSTNNNCANNNCVEITTVSDKREIQMSYLLKYLKKSFQKKYVINNTLCLSNLKIFDYFNWIKIKNFDKTKLSIGTKIELIVGNNIGLIKEITNDDIINFDNENYYKFEIDFPNSLLYKYHDIELKITMDNDNDDNSFEIIVNGSSFKISTPKMFFNNNIGVIYDHDAKWYVPNNKVFTSINGMIGILFYDNDDVFKDDDVLILYKKLEKKNLISINKIELDNGFSETCIFADVNLVDFKNQNLKFKYDYGFQFLDNKHLRKYLNNNDKLIKNTSTQSYSFGSNQYFGTVNYDVCELTNVSTCKIYFKILKTSDIIKHVDLEFKNFKTNKVNNINYEFDAWIEYDGKKIYDFGKKNMDNKIRLSCENKYVSLLALYENIIYLVIETSYDKLEDWKNIIMSIGHIYSDTIMRRNIAQYASPTINVFDK